MCAAENGRILYVMKPDGPTPPKGSPWENAYPKLQGALSDAKEGDQIWVAAGTYSPDRNPDDRAHGSGPPRTGG